MAHATAQAEAHWLQARAEGRFEIFAPHLEEVVMLVRDKAALLGQALNLSPYDALIDEFSPGISSNDIDGVFKTISRRLPSLIREAIALQEARPPLPLEGKFTHVRQRALVMEIMKAMGFAFDRGRLDESEHPFTEGVPGDMRLTTRYDQADVFTGLLSAMHETGHAHVPHGTAGAVARPAGRPGSRHGGPGKPVTAAGATGVPQPVLCPLPESLAGPPLRGFGSGLGSGQSLRASHPRAPRAPSASMRTS